MALGEIALEFVTMLAAQQNIDGDPQLFALDIHHGGVQGTHGGVDRHTASAEVSPEHIMDVLPDDLVVHGVLPQDQLREVLEHIGHAVFTGSYGNAGFTIPADPLVRIDTAHRRTKREGGKLLTDMAQEENVDACNLHGSILSWSAKNLSLRFCAWAPITFLADTASCAQKACISRSWYGIPSSAPRVT